MDGGRKEEGDVDGVGECLLIILTSGPDRIERAAVVSGLNFVRDFGAVRVSAMQEKFLSADPKFIEVGKISSWFQAGGGIRDLIGNQHAVGVQPYAGCTE